PGMRDRIFAARAASTTRGSGRSGRGGWAPLAGFLTTRPHRTACPRAWVSTRCRLSTVPPDRVPEGTTSSEYTRCRCRGRRADRGRWPTRGTPVQPDQALISLVGGGPDPGPGVGEPLGEVVLHGEGGVLL